jgi:hypothetical protein
LAGITRFPGFPKNPAHDRLMAAEGLPPLFQEGAFVRYLKKILMTSAMVIVAVAAVTSAFAQGNKYTTGPKVSNGQVRGAGGGQRGAGGQRGGGNFARGGGGRGRGSGGGGAVAAGVALGVIGVIGAAAAAAEEERYYGGRPRHYDSAPGQPRYYYD